MMASPQMLYARKSKEQIKEIIEKEKRQIVELENKINNGELCTEKPDFKTQLNMCKEYVAYGESLLKIKMNRFIYIWKNMGCMRMGYDLAELLIEFNINNYYPVLKFRTSGDFGVEIKDSSLKTYNAEILAKLSSVDIPESNIASDGCDGSAWEIQIDGKSISGYLDNPDWLKEVENIINFKEIFSYAKKKLNTYVADNK